MSRSAVVLVLLTLADISHAVKFTQEFELWLKEASRTSSYPSALNSQSEDVAGIEFRHRAEASTRAPLAATPASVTHDTDAVVIKRMQQQERDHAVAEWEDPHARARLAANRASVTGDTDAVGSEFQQMQQQRSDHANAELGELSPAPDSVILDTDAVGNEFRRTQRQQSDQASAEWRESRPSAQLAATQASVTGDTDVAGNEFQQIQQQNDQASAELVEPSPAPASETLDTATAGADFQQTHRQQGDQAGAELRKPPPRRLAFLASADSVTHRKESDADEVGTGLQQMQQQQRDQDSAKRAEPPESDNKVRPQVGVAVPRAAPDKSFGDTRPPRLPRQPPAVEDATAAQAAQIPGLISISEERSRLIKYRNQLRHDLAQKKHDHDMTLSKPAVSHSKLP